MSKAKSNGAGPEKGGKLHLFTVPDTGIQLRYRKVSPMLVGQIQLQLPRPDPPLVAVKYGDETRQEPNEADPDYKRAVQAWQAKIVQATQRATIERGVVVELDDDAKAAVAEVRQLYRETTGAELPGSDKLVYVLYVALGTGEDLDDLLKAIGRRSHPTEAAIADAEAAFRGDVSGQ